MNKFLLFVPETLCTVWDKAIDLVISAIGEPDFYSSFNDKDRKSINDLVYKMRRNKIAKTEFTDSKGITYIVEI